MSEPQRIIDQALQILENLPGIVAAKRVEEGTVQQVAEIERSYEQGALVPLKNLGVQVVLKRDVALAVLKDGHFREPPEPTVYLVEEDTGGRASEQPCVTVEGERYRIVGEEVLASHGSYGERTLALGDSFVIFPDRRSSNSIPSYFLVPPLSFFELEEAQDRLGIGGVVSISPSAQADLFLRSRCGFTADPALATLLVAFDLNLTASG